ncbi:type VI secretion system protein TssL, long form [Enterobacillus tribolii]|uniref:Type VI secretion system protein ImpK n=1 Tax=Enterobacillus tribolii TaxID=1487935 RepID=A0A370R2A5_9GAMM|nr:type VI secretion system protein TssL, long form [Enterobacillus tribolii]MBW7984868.1 type VI secretion system protein TssL [Enterobacillus tribolii]RDK96060.1 type VI secretion system protein ImpK [Enterobacillus tribolii]
MKDEFDQDGAVELNDEPILPEPTEDTNPQAMGMFLLDEQGEWAQEPDNRSPALDPFFPYRQNKNDVRLKSEGVQQRVQKVKAADNPLLEAVQPLLRALSDMPAQIIDVSHTLTLKNSLKNEVNQFSIVCDEVDIPWKKMAIVRYCICTALDEAAHATPWGLASGWSQDNLLNHFEGDNDGGNKFFLLVGRLSMNPQEFADVLEVLLRILGLGFEGRYSIIEDGERHLTKIRQRLLTILQSTRETTAPILSPHGLVTRGPRKRERLVIPVRISVMLVTLLVGSLFIWSKYWLSMYKDGIERRIFAMQRVNTPPPPPVKIRLRLAVLLKEEIRKQLVSVDETQSESKVILRGDSLFMPGSVVVRPEMIPVIERVAKEVHRVDGHIVIVGHTDSQPINKPGLPNNVVLSEKRALEVARYFLDAGTPYNQVKIKGVGDTQPVAGNNTPQGRAQNRRVEFFVTYQ